MKVRKRNLKKSKRGLVLPVVAAIALCLALLGLAVLQLGFGSRLMATRTMGSVSARASADAGVTRALYELNALFNLGDDPLATPMPPDATDMPLNNSNATYSYKVRGPFTELVEPYWMIESIGKLGTQQKTVYATLGVRNLFDYGLIVTDKITLNSGTLVDGYDTRLGSYTEFPDTTNSYGYIRIGTTSIEPRDILLHDTEVTGDVLAGIGGVVDGSNDSVIQNPSGHAITGPWYNLPEPWYFEPIIIPEAIYIPSGSIDNSTQWDGTGSYRIPEAVTGETIYLQFDKIDVPNGRNLIFLGPVVIIVNQDLELDHSANLFVGEPDPAFPTYPSSVTIYLNGDLEVKESGNINNLSRIPLNFQLYGVGPPYQNWNIKNGGDYYGIYYGPNADIRTYAAARFYGSVSGYQFILFSGGRLHYDHALSDIIGYDTGFGIDRLWEKSDFVVAAAP